MSVQQVDTSEIAPAQTLWRVLTLHYQSEEDEVVVVDAMTIWFVVVAGV
jgi:hypothetical protein